MTLLQSSILIDIKVCSAGSRRQTATGQTGLCLSLTIVHASRCFGDCSECVSVVAPGSGPLDVVHLIIVDVAVVLCLGCRVVLVLCTRLVDSGATWVMECHCAFHHSDELQVPPLGEPNPIDSFHFHFWKLTFFSVCCVHVFR